MRSREEIERSIVIHEKTADEAIERAAMHRKRVASRILGGDEDPESVRESVDMAVSAESTARTHVLIADALRWALADVGGEEAES